MTLPLSMLLVTLAAVVGNRLLAVFAALWWRVPPQIFLPALWTLDLVQIPLYYWLYQNGSTVLQRLPGPVAGWFKKDWSVSTLGRWASSLGGVGVMLVAAMPTFGGGMWSAVFISFSLGLRRQSGYLWMALGSLISYGVIFWVMDVLVSTFRYFAHA